MGRILNVNGTFYIEFEARGLKYQQIAGPDEQAACELLASIEEKIRHGEAAVIVRDIPVSLFWQEFREVAAGKYPPRTFERLLQALAHFEQFVRGRADTERLSQITPKLIGEYKHFLFVNAGSKPVKSWVINFTILLLREVFEYAIAMGYLNDNPTLHIRFVKDDRHYRADDQSAREWLGRGVSIFKLAQIMKWRDVLKAMVYFPLLRDPLKD